MAALQRFCKGVFPKLIFSSHSLCSLGCRQSFRRSISVIIIAAQHLFYFFSFSFLFCHRTFLFVFKVTLKFMQMTNWAPNYVIWKFLRLITQKLICWSPNEIPNIPKWNCCCIIYVMPLTNAICIENMQINESTNQQLPRLVAFQSVQLYSWFAMQKVLVFNFHLVQLVATTATHYEISFSFKFPT